MAASAFRPARSTRISDDVIEQIRASIFRGDLQPGDRLPSERKLAAQFGVSRVTIRDALRVLEAGGLIRVKVGGGGGPYVHAPDVETLSTAVGNHLKLIGAEFRELAEARLALETTAVRLACERATEKDLESLRLAIGHGAPSGGRDTAVSSVDFHTALVTAAHNRALLAMFNATRALMEDAIELIHTSLPDTARVARRVHTELYEAVVAGEPERAVRIMREHLYDFIERERTVQERAGEPAAPGLFL